jgi:hypothetical protein
MLVLRSANVSQCINNCQLKQGQSIWCLLSMVNKNARIISLDAMGLNLNPNRFKGPFLQRKLVSRLTKFQFPSGFLIVR